jgi:hypothetical protein
MRNNGVWYGHYTFFRANRQTSFYGNMHYQPSLRVLLPLSQLLKSGQSSRSDDTIKNITDTLNNASDSPTQFGAI